MACPALMYCPGHHRDSRTEAQHDCSNDLPEMQKARQKAG